jgi:hypothetical protein
MVERSTWLLTKKNTKKIKYDLETIDGQNKKKLYSEGWNFV